MEFLKSCRTNVRVVEDVFKTDYTLYHCGEDSSRQNSIPTAVVELRKHNVLCSAVHQQLWVFAETDADLKRLLTNEYDLIVKGKNTIAADTGEAAADGRSVQDLFLEAVESSIAFSLANEQGVTHIGSWTWLFSSTVGYEDQESIFLRLRAKLDTSGALYISTTSSPSLLLPARPEMTAGQRIVVAPSGRIARLSGGMLNDRLALDSYHEWMQQVADALNNEGIFLNSGDSWTLIEIPDSEKPKRLPWPTRVCFAPGHASVESSGTDKDWRRWFKTFEGRSDTFHDQIPAAEDWFKDAAERESTITAAAQQHAGLPTDDRVQSSINVVAETPLATSSPFNQRHADQQAAMLGIYPTPPDGFVPGHANTQPTSDGQAGTTQIDNSISSHDVQLPGGDDRPERESSSSTGPTQGYPIHSDDLFGDMAEMDFGANEVDDADFDYFDDPDEMAVETGNNGQELEMGDANDVEHELDIESGAHAVQAVEDQNQRDKDDVTAIAGVAPITDEAQTTIKESLSTEGQSNPPEAREDHDVSMLAMPGEDALEIKPLSPFGIRERILPLPIPASAIQSEKHQAGGIRNSTYGPITFNEGIDLSSKYLADSSATSRDLQSAHNGPDISIPQKRRKRRPQRRPDHARANTEDSMSPESSEEDSYESSSSDVSDEEELPPRLPWDNKKRKRTLIHDQTSTADVFPNWPAEPNHHRPDEWDPGYIAELLKSLLTYRNLMFDPDGRQADDLTSERGQPEDATDIWPNIQKNSGSSNLDVMYIAQVLSEQAVTTTSVLVPSASSSTNDGSNVRLGAATHYLMENVINHVFPVSEEYELGKLALMREAPSRPPTNPGKAPQTQHPRPVQREGSIQLGPDYFSLPPPYVRTNRGSDAMEMLPPALTFRSALGLGPANGSKDIQAVCISPANTDLSNLTKTFVEELGSVYESLKLGMVASLPEEITQGKHSDIFDERGIVVPTLHDSANGIEDIMNAYNDACTDLGAELAKIGHLHPHQTIVVFIVNPFEDDQGLQLLCACFWEVYKAYGENSPKRSKVSSRSDLVLQVLPVSLIASMNSVTLLDAQQLGNLAIEVYDRCPPSPKATASEAASMLPIFASPAVELATGPPKRILFQLSAEPPSDILHEGSVLHLAYAISKDGQWMTACWSDNTGRYQQKLSTCLRGKSFNECAEEMWDKNLEILSSRDVAWRIFVVTLGDVEASVRKCWKNFASTKTRKQILLVTFLSVRVDPELQLSPPSTQESLFTTKNGLGQGGGVFTPATTPQGTTITYSPDASGQTNAPPTPAPSENATNIAENDPEAHLVDLTDESWGVILSPAYASSTPGDSTSELANGILFKRGSLDSPDSDGKLESLGVRLHWDIRVRPSGIDEGHAKHAEITLRDVLRMYRNLSLLAKLRGLSMSDSPGGRGRGVMPVHIISAVKAAKALNGLLS